MHRTTVFDEAAERAFLLGVAPGEDTTLAVAEIEKGDDAVALTSSRALGGANGVVYVKYVSSPGSLDGAMSVAPGGDGRIVVPLSGVQSAEFYRLCVGYAVP